MREILFKGYCKEDNKWYYGSLIQTVKGYFIMPKDDGDLYSVEKSSIGQYTEFTDRTGKRIFEGDIIKVNNEAEYTVVFNTNNGWSGMNEYYIDINLSIIINEFDVEVIDNIYEE